MGRKNGRARSSRRKGRLSPVDIIAGIESPASERLSGESPLRRSPSQVIAEALSPDATLLGGRTLGISPEITRPAKRKSERPGLPDSKPAGRRSASALTQGFWAIWVQHQEYLKRHCLRWMSNNVQDAEDALSNTMLLAQRKYPEYAHCITNTRAWLTRLAHNACMDHHRAASRLEGFESDVQQDELIRRSADPYRRVVPEPDQTAIADERLKNLLRGLQSLPEALREPLVLRSLYDLAYCEIAGRMNMKESAVRKRVQLGRDKLRKWTGIIER